MSPFCPFSRVENQLHLSHHHSRKQFNLQNNWQQERGRRRSGWRREDHDCVVNVFSMKSLLDSHSHSDWEFRDISIKLMTSAQYVFIHTQSSGLFFFHFQFHQRAREQIKMPDSAGRFGHLCRTESPGPSQPDHPLEGGRHHHQNSPTEENQ